MAHEKGKFKAWWWAAGLLVLTISLILIHRSMRPSSAKSPTFNVGVIAPLSGRNARYGAWIREGAQLAVDEINAKQGVGGRKIVLSVQDDAGDPAKATLAMRQLISASHVTAVYGPWASSSVLAIAPIAEQQKVVVLASAIAPKITEAGDFVFRMQPSARYYLAPLVPYVHGPMGLKRIGIVYINNDFGLDQSRLFAERFRALGGQVALIEGYPENSTDFRALLTKLRGARVDGVFMASYAESAAILKQAREVGLNNIRFLGSVPTENPDLLTIAGSAAEGVVFPSHFDQYSADPGIRQFQDRYTKRYGRPAEGLAALAYDGVYALAAAGAAKGIDGPQLRDGLYALPVTPGVTGPTSFDRNGDVIKPIVIKTVKDGRFVRVATPN